MCPRALFSGRSVIRNHPPTVATVRWYCALAPRIPVCSGGCHGPVWWTPYSWRICTASSRDTSIFREAAVYVFKCGLRLHDKEAIHRHVKGGEGTTLLETGLQILLLIIIIHYMKILIRWLVLAIQGVSVHTTHVVNKVSTYPLEVTEEKVYLMLRVIYSLWWIFGRVSYGMVLYLLQCTDLMDEGFVMHVWGGEGFARKVRDPITEFVVMIRDEASIIEIQGVENWKLGIVAITVRWKVWRLYDVAYKERVAPLLIPQFLPIHRGRQHGEPGPRIGSPSQLTDIQRGGRRHGLPQIHLWVLNVMAPDITLDLPQEHTMYPGFEICPHVESCNQVSLNDTRGHTVLPSGQSRVWDCQPHLIDGQVGDPSWQEFCGGALKKGWEEGIMNFTIDSCVHHADNHQAHDHSLLPSALVKTP